MLLTSGFQFFRGAPIDGAVFLLGGLVLLADALGLLRFLRFRFERPGRAVAILVGAIVVALLTFLPRYSVLDVALVIGVGITAALIAWSDPGNPAGPRLATTNIRRAAILWSALGVLLCLCELGSFFLGLPSPAAEYAHPPLSDLIGPPLDNPILRAIGVAIWLLGGYALLGRGKKR